MEETSRRGIDIMYMQVRVYRLACEKWAATPDEILNIFKRNHLFEKIKDCYGAFHLYGDEGVLEDLYEMIFVGEKPKATGNVSSFEKYQQGLRIDLAVALAIEQLAQEHHQPYSEVCADFLGSNLWKILNSPGDELWTIGSNVLAECFDAEQEHKAKKAE